MFMVDIFNHIKHFSGNRIGFTSEMSPWSRNQHVFGEKRHGIVKKYMGHSVYYVISVFVPAVSPGPGPRQGCSKLSKDKFFSDRPAST